MRTHILLTVAAVLVCAGSAVADEAKKPAKDAQDFVFLGDTRPVLVRLRLFNEGKPHQEAWEEFIGFLLKYADKDNDGVLAKEEVDRLPPPSFLFGGNYFGGFAPRRPGGASMMEQLDTNKDDKVSLEELGEFYRKNGGAPFQLSFSQGQSAIRGGALVIDGRRPNAQPSADLLNEKIFTLLDTDKDGKLSKEEMAAASVRLLKLDADDDELVAVAEVLPSADPYGLAGFVVVEGGGMGSPKPANPTFVAVAPGESSTELARQLQARYSPKGSKPGDKKLTAKDVGLDEDTFKQLDKDSDGALDAEELARFAQRPPDVELTVQLGKKVEKEKAVEINGADRKTPLASSLTKKDGGVTLDLGVTRFDLRTGGGAQNDPVQLTRQIYKMQFSAADQDNNGYLDEAEAKRSGSFRDLFKVMDRDGDGMLYEKEMVEFLDKMQEFQAKANSGCITLSVADQGRGVFDLLDANKDGTLSVREARGAVKLLESLDRDKDAHLAKNEIPRSYQLTVNQGPLSTDALGARAIVVRAFADFGMSEPAASTTGPVWYRKMDRNRDGDVSKREFLGTDAEFQRIDTDGDGLISAEEAEKFDALMKKQKEEKR
jgi:Ca2+-binding EF-hand superfamily protein